MKQLKGKTHIVVTCKGRLRHLQHTLPLMLRHTPAAVRVVDYSCPDGTAEWVEDERKRIWQTDSDVARRIDIVDVPGRAAFNKPAALNAGAAGIGGPRDWLLFLDADTIVTEHFWPWIVEHHHPGNFLFAEGKQECKDVTGFLFVQARKFQESGGFDPAFNGWGAEDLDMRMRLHFMLNLPFVMMPPELLQSIPHEHSDRTRFYAEKNTAVSHEANLQILINNYRLWTGRNLVNDAHDEKIRKLIGVYGWQE